MEEQTVRCLETSSKIGKIEALAESMIPLIGKLYRKKNISTYMYGNSMVNKSVTDLMQDHRFIRQVESNEISEFDTYPILEAILNSRSRSY